MGTEQNFTYFVLEPKVRCKNKKLQKILNRIFGVRFKKLEIGIDLAHGEDMDGSFYIEKKIVPRLKSDSVPIESDEH